MSDEMTQDGMEQKAVDDEIAAQPSWRDVLPEGMKESATLADVKDIPALAKQFIDAQKYIGSSVRIPSEDATAAAWEAFDAKLKAKVPTLARVDPEAPDNALKALGRPKDADGYNLPEGIGRDDPLVQAGVQAGLTQKQMRDLLDPIVEKAKENQLLEEGRQSTERTRLREEWGAAYNVKVAKALATAKLTGAPESLISAMESGNIDYSTAMWLEAVASKLGDEGIGFTQDTAAGKDVMTPYEARQQAAEIYDQLQDMSPSDPRYRVLVQKRVKLFEHAGSH